MKKTVRTKVMATILAAVCALSTGAAISAVSANAAIVRVIRVETRATSEANNETKPAPKATARSCAYTMTGYDWNYSADSVNVKITCDFNYSTKTCRFIGTAVAPGTTNATLKAKRADGKWDNIPVRFTVDSSLNISVVKTGNAFVTSN